MRCLGIAGAIAAALLVAAPQAQAVDHPQPRACLAVTQGVTEMKGISCRNARKVARAYYRADLPRRPECRGQGSIRWNGWRVTGVGTLGIATRFRKGTRSFLLSGGGTC